MRATTLPCFGALSLLASPAAAQAAESAVPGAPFLAAAATSTSGSLWYWMIGFTVTAYIVTLLLLPVIACLIPEDYFQRKEPLRLFAKQHPALALVLNGVKNLLGGCFVVCGIAMLVLPGPGLISILLGLVMLDFPGKIAAETWFLRWTRAIKAVNWIRSKWKRPPLKLPEE